MSETVCKDFSSTAAVCKYFLKAEDSQIVKTTAIADDSEDYT